MTRYTFGLHGIDWLGMALVWAWLGVAAIMLRRSIDE